jgi:hypothetical protein
MAGEVHQRDENRKVGTLRTLQGDGALQLFGQRADQLEAEGVGRSEVQLVREAAAGIPDPQHEGPLGRRPQRHTHAPSPPLGEGVLETIGEQLVQYEAARSAIPVPPAAVTPDLLDADQRPLYTNRSAMGWPRRGRAVHAQCESCAGESRAPTL